MDEEYYEEEELTVISRIRDMARVHKLVSIDFLDERSMITNSDPKLARLSFSNGEDIVMDFDQFANLNDFKFERGNIVIN